jgi:hypothetical protein
MHKDIQAHGKTVSLSHTDCENEVPAITVVVECGQTRLLHTITFGSVDDYDQPLLTKDQLQGQIDIEHDKLAKIAAHREHMRELKAKFLPEDK